MPINLLNRPFFNQKLLDTFYDTEKERFDQWNSATHVIVYDACSSELKYAVSAINTSKKFSERGWKGKSYILQGGFEEFSKRFPNLIDNQLSQAGSFTWEQNT